MGAEVAVVWGQAELLSLSLYVLLYISKGVYVPI